MPLILCLFLLLATAMPAWAKPFSDLSPCGVQGRPFEILNSGDPHLPDGAYFRITKLTELTCPSWGWLFLADPEFYSYLQKAHRAGSQLVLFEPQRFTISEKDYIAKALVVARGSPIYRSIPMLDSTKPTIFLSRQTSLYDFIHEFQHVEDFDGYSKDADAHLPELTANEHLIIKNFLLEIRAYAEQLRALKESQRALDFEFRGNSAFLTNGLLFRLSEVLSLKQDFRSIYVKPLRELLDGLLKHEPDFAEKLILKISDLVVREDLLETDSQTDLPELDPCEGAFTVSRY